MNIKVKSKKYVKQSDNFSASYDITLEGIDINNKITCALCRTCMLYVSRWGINTNDINIESNTSIAYNNSSVREKMSYIPINLPENIDSTSYGTVDVKNTNKLEPIDVTSNDIVFNVDGKPYNIFKNDKFKYLIIRLNPGEEFKCHFSVTRGRGIEHDRWSGAKNAWHTYTDDGKHTIHIRNSIVDTEMNTLKSACTIMTEELKRIQHDMLSPDNDLEKEDIQINISDIDECTMRAFCYELQEYHMCALAVVNPHVKLMKLTISTHVPSSVKKDIIQAFDKLVRKIEHIKNLID